MMTHITAFCDERPDPVELYEDQQRDLFLLISTFESKGAFTPGKSFL